MNATMMPALRRQSFGLFGNRVFDHIADGRQIQRYRSGRLAITAALNHANIGAGSDVLVPAYHCLSMVEPIEAVGARAVFYRILPDLTPDIDDICKKLDSRTRSIIAVHFFGGQCSLSPLREIASKIRAVLIEDCAHCFSFSRFTPGYGQTGDYIVTSPRKFLPVMDGGELVFSRAASIIPRQGVSGIRYQIKIAANTIERAFKKDTISEERCQTTSRSSTQSNGMRVDTHEAISPDEFGSEYLDPRFDYSHVMLTSSLLGRVLTRILSLQRVEDRRRLNFQKLESAFQSFKRASQFPLNLVHGSVPYVFPILIENAADTHSQLKRINVPMWRWDDIRHSDCAISKDYSMRLIQLPCHQELTDASLDNMIDGLRSVLG